MNQQPTLPSFGEIVPGEGGRLGAIMRGEMVDGVRLPDYAVIVPDAKGTQIAKAAYGCYGVDIAGTGSLLDGLANTRAMAAAGSDTAKKVLDMKVNGHADLYIPSRGEMWALRANVPELFEKEYHWTSTQGGRYYAYVQYVAYGYSGWGTKGNDYRVRAVRRIQLHHVSA